MTTLEGTWRYGYDASGQLTSVNYPDGHPVRYDYDAAGNRTAVTDAGMRTGYTPNNMNQYTAVGAASYTYDNDGNLWTKTEGGVTTTYTYDIENRLIGVSTPTDTWTYSYDAFGQRVGSTHNGVATQYVIDPTGLGDVAAEYDGAGNLVARYDHGFGLVSREDAVGNPAYYTFSAIGNTSELTNSAGAVVNSYAYDPFGISLGKSETVPNPFEFVGEYGVMNEGNGLEFMRARFYSSCVGQFITDDPYGILGGDVSFRRYVGNNPLAMIDPAGLAGYVLNQPMGGFWGTDNSLGTSRAWSGQGMGLNNPAFQYVPNVGVIPEGTYVLGKRIKWSSSPDKKLMEDCFRLILPLETYLWGKPVYKMRSGFLVHGGSQDPLWRNKSSKGCIILPLEIRRQLQPGDTITVTSRVSALTGPPSPVRSNDPNDKTAPSGFGTAAYVQATNALAYQVSFENKAEATAPAQRIIITDTLDPNLDLRTLELNEIAFAKHTISVPRGMDSYKTSVDLRPEGVATIVQIDIALDLETRQLTATFTAIDPATGWLPDDLLIGLLYPNDSTGRGDGHISYSVWPRADVPSGTEITNKATIVFDWNDPIDTPLTRNTLDASAPSSAVAALPLETHSKDFTVTWSGADETNGSGLAAYSVYVSIDGGEYLLWLDRTPETQGVYHGQSGHTYAFYSAATDNVGHVELPPEIADAQTTVALGALATWSGGGTDGKWSTADNWWGTPLANGDALRFSGTTQLAATNDRAPGIPVSGITFHTDAGAFVLDGNSVGLAGDVTNNSANTQTINLPLVLLGGNRTLDAAAGDLIIGRAITEEGGSYALTKTGSGRVTLSAANGYTGDTIVSQGILQVAHAGALPIDSALSIAAGATVVLAPGLNAASAAPPAIVVQASRLPEPVGQVSNLPTDVGRVLNLPMDVGEVANFHSAAKQPQAKAAAGALPRASAKADPARAHGPSATAEALDAAIESPGIRASGQDWSGPWATLQDRQRPSKKAPRWDQAVDRVLAEYAP
jgi:RHS repeat-associated protein